MNYLGRIFISIIVPWWLSVIDEVLNVLVVVQDCSFCFVMTCRYDCACGIIKYDMTVDTIKQNQQNKTNQWEDVVVGSHLKV